MLETSFLYPVVGAFIESIARLYRYKILRSVLLEEIYERQYCTNSFQAVKDFRLPTRKPAEKLALIVYP
jgi:hypothetical protein